MQREISMLDSSWDLVSRSMQMRKGVSSTYPGPMQSDCSCRECKECYDPADSTEERGLKDCEAKRVDDQ